MTFTIFPAVDILKGRAVQLVRGQASSAKVFGSAVEAARRWKRQGAAWLHLVDLDAAFGKGNNASLVSEIIATTGLNVELTGGIRDEPSLQRALATGCARVNIGTAAVKRPDWTDEVVASYGERIAVALDVRGESLATHGWTSASGSMWEVVDRLTAAGCRRFVVTDTEVDGTLSGANVDLLLKVAERTSAQVVASGGVASLDDVYALAQAADRGIEGVIVGSALYLKKFTLKQALAVAAGTMKPPFRPTSPDLEVVADPADVPDTDQPDTPIAAEATDADITDTAEATQVDVPDAIEAATPDPQEPDGVAADSESDGHPSRVVPTRKDEYERSLQVGDDQA
jgi:phosphoribosylanthranilate isomerase